MPLRFKKFIYISLVAHVLLFIMVMVFPDISRLLPAKKQKITWLRFSKGLGDRQSQNPFKKTTQMPYSTLQEQKKALQEINKSNKGKDDKTAPLKVKRKEEKEPQKKRVSESGAVNLKKPKTVQDQTIENALARIEQQLEKRQVEIEAAQVEDDGGGQSIHGSLDSSDVTMDPELLAYYEKLKEQINREWITIPKQSEGVGELKTQINVMIDSEGRMISASFELKSGDPSFDLTAMRAIERAQPFPAPPEKIKDEAISEGFLIEFNPGSVVGGN